MKSRTKTAFPATTTSTWDSLTEQQLLDRQFSADDPETLPNLMDTAPSPEDEAWIEYAYDLNGTSHGLIRCVHCRKTIHRAGIVIRTKAGRRALVGRDCGRAIYKDAFVAMVGDFDRAVRKGKALKDREQIRGLLPNLIKSIKALIAAPCFSDFGKFRYQFRERMPRLYGELSVVFRQHEGRLSVWEDVPDIEAEVRADERYDVEMERFNKLSVSARKHARQNRLIPKKRSGRIYKSIERIIGTLVGSSFFADETFPGRKIYDAAERLTDLHAQMDQTGLSSNALERANKEVFDLLDMVESQIGRLRDARALFSSASMMMFSEWASTRSAISGKFRVEPGLVLVQVSNLNNSETRLAFPSPFEVPSISFIQKFRREVR